MDFTGMKKDKQREASSFPSGLAAAHLHPGELLHGRCVCGHDLAGLPVTLVADSCAGTQSMDAGH